MREEIETPPAQVSNIQTEVVEQQKAEFDLGGIDEDDDQAMQSSQKMMPIDNEYVVHKQQNLNWQKQQNHNWQSHYILEPKKTGDFGMTAANSKPNRKMMDKIA